MASQMGTGSNSSAMYANSVMNHSSAAGGPPGPQQGGHHQPPSHHHQGYINSHPSSGPSGFFQERDLLTNATENMKGREDS